MKINHVKPSARVKMKPSINPAHYTLWARHNKNQTTLILHNSRWISV